MKPAKRRRHVSRLPHPETLASPSSASDRLSIPIRELMSRDVVGVFGDIGIDTLEELLLERQLSGVPVVDRDRRLIGYVALTDIMREHHDHGDAADPDDRAAWGFHTQLEPTTVAEVMTPVALELQDARCQWPSS